MRKLGWRDLPEDIQARIFNDERFLSVERQRLSLVCKAWAKILDDPDLQPAHISLFLYGKEDESSCLRLLTNRARFQKTLEVFHLGMVVDLEFPKACLASTILGSLVSLRLRKLSVANVLGPWIPVLAAFQHLQVLIMTFHENEGNNQIRQLAQQTSLLSGLKELDLVSCDKHWSLRCPTYVSSCNIILETLFNGAITFLRLDPMHYSTSDLFWNSLDQLASLRALALTYPDGPSRGEIGLGKLPELSQLHVPRIGMLEYVTQAFPKLEVLEMQDSEIQDKMRPLESIKLFLGILLKFPKLREVHSEIDEPHLTDLYDMWQLVSPKQKISLKVIQDNMLFGRPF